ncbi:MAG: NADH-quinone oxidoreductase subunit H [Elusimicrobiales bacterium]|nr:NADH-quinone oxidoreductase subunit H [Elusimicrobiales bacterium]
MDGTIKLLIYIGIFPGFFFLSVYATFIQWVDRKLSAKLQNRVGPPIYQPIADFIKLIAKEVIIPDNADIILFKSLPYIALAGILTSITMLPITGSPLIKFEGDIVVVIYLLTIPTVTFFLAGWSSTSPYATLGSMRVMTQLFGYEVPLFLSIAGPAIVTGSWSLYEISKYFSQNIWLIPLHIPALIAALLSSQGKLERVPFDAPHAKNEVVGGQFTEYSGRLLAFFYLAMDIEMIALAALISTVFLGGVGNLTGFYAFITFLLKTSVVCIILTFLKVLMARVRIDQMIKFSWKYLVTLSIIQIIIDLYIKLK